MAVFHLDKILNDQVKESMKRCYRMCRGSTSLYVAPTTREIQFQPVIHSITKRNPNRFGGLYQLTIGIDCL